jgi:hypothetical protein
MVLNINNTYFKKMEFMYQKNGIYVHYKYKTVKVNIYHFIYVHKKIGILTLCMFTSRAYNKCTNMNNLELKINALICIRILFFKHIGSYKMNVKKVNIFICKKRI